MRKIVNAAMALLLVAGVAACQWRPPAASVDGNDITIADLDADVEVMRANPDLANAFGLFLTPEGEPVPASVTSQLLTLRIAEIVLADAAATVPQPDAAKEAEIRQNIVNQLGKALGAQDDAAAQAAVDQLPKEFVQRLLDRFVHADTLLGNVPDDQVEQVAHELFGNARITVHSRYGTWDPEALEVAANLPPGASDNPTLTAVES